MEEKLAELESRIAFQDQEIQTLDNVIIGQQRQIDQLAEQIKLLKDKIQDMKPASVVPESDETPPPHY